MEIRIAVIMGVAKILALYWEMIPHHVIKFKDILISLINKLAFDVSASRVRGAVMEVEGHTHTHTHL